MTPPSRPHQKPSVASRMASTAEQISTAPKIIAIAVAEACTASDAPAIAPSVVATSRNMAIRMLEKPSLA